MTGERTIAEQLTQQFYDWEIRGRGWVVWERPVDLEPSFRPFEGHRVYRTALGDDGIQENVFSRVGRGVLGLLGSRSGTTDGLFEPPAVDEPEPSFIEAAGERIELRISLPPDYEPKPAVFAQCLQALSECRAPLSFEVIGDPEGIVTLVTALEDDAEFVFGQLKAHFPEAVILAGERLLESTWPQTGEGMIHEMGLANEFVCPLRSGRELVTDPLVALCGACEHLRAGEVAVVQVLFQPATAPWAENIRRAVTTSDGKPFFENAPELLAQAKEKTSSPLHAVVLRLAAVAAERSRVRDILRQLAGVMSLYDHPTGNRLQLLDNDGYAGEAHWADLFQRTSCRSGMLLNSDELVSLAHLPTAAVRSRKLVREVKHTKAAPEKLTGAGMVLGENTHEGKMVQPALSVAHRVRHVHVVGASGTGKSTLLCNMVCQDIYQGNGLAVIDPHGDLVDQIMGYIPPERIPDTILIDPADGEFPVGLNLLTAHSDHEKNLLASDLVAVFRRLSASWGDQMNSVLGNGLLAFLESDRGGTLADLRRFLIEPDYRKEFLSTVRDPEVVYYWQREYPLLKSGSLGPLMTRLDTFLRPKAIRHMVAQRANKIDFGNVMNDGKILLVKLSEGLIGEENAALLGAVLVSKFQQLALARQAISQEQRRPFFLYLDEFQNFVSPSMAAILAGARKYQLGLVLAHQDLRQLTRDSELSGAVLANTATRICFRVGDNDAEKLAAGFAEFDADDLRRLETGQAICRVERADHDFNLTTRMPPQVEEADARQRREYIRDLTRRRYGTPREQVEAELAASRIVVREDNVDPFARRTAAVKPATKTTPEKENVTPEPEITNPLTPPGRAAPVTQALVPKLGSPEDREHRQLQNRLLLIAQQRGWAARKEAGLGGHGNADVLLTKHDFKVACEVALTSPPDYEVQSIRKRLAAGMTHVLVLGTDPDHLANIEALAKKEFGKLVGVNIRFGPPEFVGPILDELDASSTGGEDVIGEMHVRYQAKVVSEPEQRQRDEMLKLALKRLKGGKTRSRA